MLTIVLSKLVLVLLLVLISLRFYNVARKLHNYKNTYADFMVYPIPSVEQARRLRVMRELEIKCYCYLILAILLVSIFIISLM